jgi:clan AA aspartic protease
MGLTYVDGWVLGSRGRKRRQRFLVDSGAMYTLLPKKAWKGIGLRPLRKMSFSLADGTLIERRIAEARLRLPQGEAHTPVILGEDGDEALLGVVTLEILGLVLNPFDRTLQPMRAAPA